MRTYDHHVRISFDIQLKRRFKKNVDMEIKVHFFFLKIVF